MPLPHVFTTVVVVDDVVVELVVVLDAGLHSGGYGTNCGTVSRSVQSTLNSVTQSTQLTTSCRSSSAPPQLEPPFGHGHVRAVRREADLLRRQVVVVPARLVGPAHALQMFCTFLTSAFWIAAAALLSPGDGHGLCACP
jgi:hypothetical protein